MKNELREELFNLFIGHYFLPNYSACIDSYSDYKELKRSAWFDNKVLDLFPREVIPEQYEARAMKGTLKLLTTDANLIVGVRGRPEGVHRQKILITVVEE